MNRRGEGQQLEYSYTPVTYLLVVGGSVGAILLLCIILCAAILVPCAVHKLKTKVSIQTFACCLTAEITYGRWLLG